MVGGSVNWVPDPIHLIDIRVQGIYNDGGDNDFLSDAKSTFRAQSIRGAMALRFCTPKELR
jgi:hypothetical protein